MYVSGIGAGAYSPAVSIFLFCMLERHGNKSRDGVKASGDGAAGPVSRTELKHCVTSQSQSQELKLASGIGPEYVSLWIGNEVVGCDSTSQYDISRAITYKHPRHRYVMTTPGCLRW